MKTILSLLLIALFTTANAQNNIVWKFETNNRVYSTPFIDGESIFVGSNGTYLYSINKKTGNENWKYQTNGKVNSDPFVSGNLVFASSNDGVLQALNKLTGELVWNFKSLGEKQYDLWDYYISSPSLLGESIFWGSGDGHLYCLDKNTGELNWKYNTGSVIHATPTLDNDHVYIGNYEGYLFKFRRDNGQLIWKFRTIGSKYFPRGEIQKGVLVDSTTVYFGSRDYNMYAIDKVSGRANWNYKQASGWIIATPLEHNDHIYFGTSDAHMFYCMNKQNGEIVWKLPLNMRVYGTATYYKNKIYFGTFDGKILGVNPMSGKIEWEFQTDSSIENYPNVFDNNGSFRKDFELYGKDMLESEKKIHALGSILSGIAIENDILYFGSSDGSVYAVRIEN